MPNDMSHPPSSPSAAHPAQSPSLVARLTARARQYCARADALIRASDLTVGEAAGALDHLAALQRDLADERLRQCRALKSDLAQAEARFKPSEAALQKARTALSSALLRAQPGPGDAFGLVPHDRCEAVATDDARTPDPAASRGLVPGPPLRAVSACRALLDLEALRPYLSDHALCHAIEQHARVTGQHHVRGVAYAALPNSAHLPCEVF